MYKEGLFGGAEELFGFFVAAAAGGFTAGGAGFFDADFAGSGTIGAVDPVGAAIGISAAILDYGGGAGQAGRRALRGRDR